MFKTMYNFYSLNFAVIHWKTSTYSTFYIFTVEDAFKCYIVGRYYILIIFIIYLACFPYFFVDIWKFDL